MEKSYIYTRVARERYHILQKAYGGAMTRATSSSQLLGNPSSLNAVRYKMGTATRVPSMVDTARMVPHTVYRFGREGSVCEERVVRYLFLC